jgi:phosphoribosylaminoimidazolecarboxamide formyltransferase/IMP cyclohydrolase
MNMAVSMDLKYGCNPNQQPARVFMKTGELPITVLNGRPGYINLLDALNGWQLVKELKEATHLPAATSFKHVSPAGAALGLTLNYIEKKMYFVDGELSPLACAYARARGADRMSSFGDFIALSDTCDLATAHLIAREVSDGVIAPGYEAAALELLETKRKGAYTILQIDPNYVPDPVEAKDVFGVTFEQNRNEFQINESLLQNIVTQNDNLPSSAKRDLILALITLKYTQSNSVCFASEGQTIGVGAGQQSRIHCTRLAASKADTWALRHHQKVLDLRFKEDIARPTRDNCIDVYLGEDYRDILDEMVWRNFFVTRPEPLTALEKHDWLAGTRGISLASDAFFPFDDNIRRANRSGVSYIAQPGGSIRDAEVIAACDSLGLTMAFTGMRLFHH